MAVAAAPSPPARATVAAAPVNGVTFLGDFLRPDAKGRPGGVDRMVGWLHNACRRQIGLAASLPCEVLTPTTSPGLTGWLTTLRPPARADDLWAATFGQLPATPDWDDAVARHILAPLRGRFCVGYEMPPFLVALLDRAAIPYVDIRLHPIRFMDDLLFAVRAAHPQTMRTLASLAVPEGEVIATAGLREAMCQFIADAAVPPNTLLVLGQREFDATQIIDGRFFDAADHQADIAAICARHSAVLLKPHPLAEQHSLLRVTRAVAPRLFGPSGAQGTVNDNIYRLLSMPEITAVLSVSSSAAVEARYFGKAVYTLGQLAVRPIWRGGEPGADTHASLDDIVLSADFWRHLLAPHAEISACDGVRLPAKPNRLRIALDSFWNYNEIDTDRLPRRAA